MLLYLHNFVFLATKKQLPMTSKQQKEMEEIISSLTLQLSMKEREIVQQSLKGNMCY